MKMRIEKDSLGVLRVPERAYYGVQTARAMVNFPISGLTAHRDFIWAGAAIKKAVANVNNELGLLESKKAAAIEAAAAEVMEGRFDDEFVVDVYQAGAGTSHHMNLNEVIANRACELIGGVKGDHTLLHPNDHVNFGQSTNDVFPTAMRLAILRALPQLLAQFDALEKTLHEKAHAFTDVIKSGRTHLQDAVPVTLGQEFSAYALTVRRSRDAIAAAADDLRELGIGGSAAGTGLNTDPRYPSLMVTTLSQLLEQDLRPAKNLFESMQSMRPFAAFSGSLREGCLELTRIANDLRLLSSGPNTGLNEIILPAVQPGSSIMPGKVNPVMAEMLNMVCFQVMGFDTTVAMAVQAGQLELNVMMPVIIHNIMQSMTILSNALKAFTERAVGGITANTDICQHYFANSLGLATVLNVLIGYDRAAEVMKQALCEKKTVLHILEEKRILSKEQISRLFAANKLTQPGVPELQGG
ncbi:aspartate ammonia-lyase [candidate division KSB1 bacterium]|nr:aspartate ammonia-lyase [candidate division KSB1 bacterium]